jgi:predicted ATPase/DNA-binding CsgD family transcriptional regulator
MPPVALEGQVTCLRQAGRLPLRQAGRLPAEATVFIGRKAEVAAVSGLLRTARLVTVVGPAGVGKTRVSLHAAAAADAAGQFPDGTWLIDLTALTDSGLAGSGLAGSGLAGSGRAGPARIGGLVAAALGVAAGPAALPDHLRGKRLLLILDTCDRVVDACAAFTETVLRTAPGVTVLATSRQPLDAPGEHTFPVPPLPAETEAVELFAQRAAAVVPGFTVSGTNRAEIVRVCRQLDGLPLAIELAALRLRALPIGELAHRLEAGFAVLDATRRGTTARHQTLRASLEWSYELCTPPERELWARLSVFAGTFGAGAAGQVCADVSLPRLAVSEALVGLVDKSIVLRDATVPHGPARYRLQPASRQFGADLLAATSCGELIFDQLTAYCQDLVSNFDEHLRHGGRPEAPHALGREYPNVRAALEYALQAWPRRGAALASRLTGYWQLSGRFAEGEDWLGQAVALSQQGPGATGGKLAPERSRALAARGRLAIFRGDPAAALRDLSESIRLATADGQRQDEVRGYLYLSLALALSDKRVEAQEAAETACRRLTPGAERATRTILAAQHALRCMLAGDAEQALSYAEQGLAPRAGEAGDERGLRPAGLAAGGPWLTCRLHLIAGFALLAIPGRDRESTARLRLALAATHELGDLPGTGYALEAYGWLAARSGHPERAAWLFGAADRLWERAQVRLDGIAFLAAARADAVAWARESLGTRKYDAARTRGCAVSLDLVVRVVLDSAAEPPLLAGADGGAGAHRVRAAGADFATGLGDGRLPDGAGGEYSGVVGGTVSPAGLTRREWEIAGLVASGLSNREIATQLSISRRTVDAHVEHIFAKLEISSRVQLTVLLRDHPAARQAAGEAGARVATR